MPLYELVERLYAIFQLERLNEQSAYLCAFYDRLNQFVQDHVADIDAFIREWEETICSKTIQSDATDGVRILSIHKSSHMLSSPSATGVWRCPTCYGVNLLRLPLALYRWPPSTLAPVR